MEIGKQSIRLEKPVYVESWASVVGKKEGEGPLAPFFDEIETDDQLGQDNWEEAESMLQQKAARLAIKKAGCCPEDIRIIFAGDLLAQSIASSFGIGELERPLYGVFGACSTMGEALSLGAITVVGRPRRAGAGSDIQPFCHGGERIPFSAGLRKPEAAVGFLDGYGKRSLRAEPEEGKSKDHRTYHRKSGGLRIERLPEYGCMYGTGSVQYDCTESERFWKRTGGVRSDHHRRSRLCRAADPVGFSRKRRLSGGEKSQRLWDPDVRPEDTGYPCGRKRVRL